MGLLRGLRGVRRWGLEADGEQHVREFFGVEVVGHAGGHDEHAAGGEVVALAGGVDGEAAAEDLDEHRAAGAVLAQLAAGLEHEQRQRRGAVAVKGLLAMPGVGGGGFAGQLRGGGAEVKRLRGGGEAIVGVGAGAVGGSVVGLGHVLP